MRHAKTVKKRSIAHRFIPVLFCSVTLIVIFAVAVLAIILPKEKVSPSEQRVLEQSPKFTLKNLFSGDYTADFEKYYSDTFPLRNELTDKAKDIEALRGIRDEVMYETDSNNEAGAQGTDEEKKKIYESFMYRNEEPAVMEMSKPHPTLGTSSQSENENPSGGDGGQDIENPLENEEGNYVNNIFVVGDTAFEIFGRNDKQGSAYAKIINKWRAKLPESVRVYNLIVPKNSAFSLPEKYASKNGDQKAGIEHIYSELSSGITPVRIFDTLNAHKNEYLFFRTDHHWTQRGAYYAYTEFAKAAGFTPHPISDFEIKTFDGYLGTLYNSTKDKKLKANPDTVEAFMAKDRKFTMTYYITSSSGVVECKRNYIIRSKPTSARNSYGVFIDGDNPLTIIKNDSEVKTGRKLVMVKESYGNCFAPFMALDFDEVYVVDQRYYNKLVSAGKFPKLAKLIERDGITDVLFINNIQAAIGGLKNYVESLL